MVVVKDLTKLTVRDLWREVKEEEECTGLLKLSEIMGSPAIYGKDRSNMHEQELIALGDLTLFTSSSHYL